MRSIITGLILSTVVALSIAKPSSNAVIECDFKINYIDFEEIYECEVRNKDDFGSVDEVAPVIERIAGKHKTGMSNQNVHTLTMRGGRMDLFFKGVGTLFPNIKSIHIENVQLKAINKGNLDQFPHLQSLILIDNKIENIDDGWLAKNTKIQVISLQGNPITEIHPNAFSNLNFLTYLDLTNNKCPNLNMTTAKNPQDVEKLREEIEYGKCLVEDFFVDNKNRKIEELSNENRLLKRQVENLKDEHALKEGRFQYNLKLKKNELEIIEETYTRNNHMQKLLIKRLDEKLTECQNNAFPSGFLVQQLESDIYQLKQEKAECQVKLNIAEVMKEEFEEEIVELTMKNQACSKNCTVPSNEELKICKFDLEGKEAEFLQCRTDLQELNNKCFELEYYPSKFECMKFTNPLNDNINKLKREMQSNKLNYEDDLSTCREFEKNFNELKDQIASDIQNNDKNCSADMDQFITLLKEEITRKEMILKKCENRTKKCIDGKCEPCLTKPCPDCTDCDGIMGDLADEIDDLTNKHKACKMNLKDASDQIYEIVKKIISYETHIAYLTEVILKGNPIPECLPGTPTPTPPGDSNELSNLKEVYRKCLVRAKVAEEMYQKCADRCDVTKNCNEVIRDLRSCDEELGTCKESLLPECQNEVKEAYALHETLMKSNRAALINVQQCRRTSNDCYIDLQGEIEKNQICQQHGSTCNEPACIKYTEPLQSWIDLWSKRFQTCQTALDKLETEKSECLITVNDYNVSLANCVNSLKKECPPINYPPIECPLIKPPTPSTCDWTLGEVKIQLEYCNRERMESQIWKRELEMQLEVLKGDVDFCNINLNTMTKNLNDCDLKYKDLSKECSALDVNVSETTMKAD